MARFPTCRDQKEVKIPVAYAGVVEALQNEGKILIPNASGMGYVLGLMTASGVFNKKTIIEKEKNFKVVGKTRKYIILKIL